MAMTDRVFEALDRFRIELPSWGFADTGTRFGVFRQPAAAATLAEKVADAGRVHALTGVCPTVALHVQWDVPGGVAECAAVLDATRQAGIRPGAVNPNWFQDQRYKHGSFGSVDPAVRRQAIDHGLDSIAIAQALGSRDISCWFADGSNYPGTANVRDRKRWFEEGLRALHDRLPPDARLLVEYKPFEPAFYHTDIADWGMALLLAKAAGPRAKVLVDTGVAAR
jgi:L-rhamnose isomerase/sugar isomerase